MEWLDTIIGAVVGAASYWAGTRRPIKKPYEDSNQPICGCKHHFSMHDPTSKQCHAQVKTTGHYNEKSQYVYTRQCACRNYTGPEPLPEYYA